MNDKTRNDNPRDLEAREVPAAETYCAEETAGTGGEASAAVPLSRTAKVMALSLGQTLMVASGIVFAMVASRLLTLQQYATFRQTFLAYDFVAPLLVLGLPNAVYYFLPRRRDDRRGAVVDNIVLLAAMGLLFSLFIALGGHRLLAERFHNPDLRDTLPWLIPYPLFLMPLASLSAVLVCAEKTHTLAAYNIITSLLLTAAGVVAVAATKSYTLPVLVRVFVPAVFLPVGLFLMFRAVPGPLRRPQWHGMCEMVRYAVPLGLATMVGTLRAQMHNILVSSLCSPEDFAVYYNGAMELPLIGVVTGSITSVVFAEMADLCSRGRKAEALELFRKAAARSASLLLPTMVFFLAAAQPFIVVLYSEKYLASAVPFAIFLFTLPIRVVVYGSALMALGLSRVILFRSILDLVVNLILCFVLIPTTGYLGAAVAMVLTLYLWTIPYNLHKIAQGFGVSWKQTLPFRTLGRIFLRCLPAWLPAALVAHALPLPAIVRLALAATVYGPITVYLLYRGGFLIFPSWLERKLPAAMKVRT